MTTIVRPKENGLEKWHTGTELALLEHVRKTAKQGDIDSVLKAIGILLERFYFFLLIF